ncbi:hypothetical protein PENCOP_c001G01626 [Penicillium coprophilum]|uniref:Uncharacterized protein n=1 Tax=Penicillium coprophilum TaxID=36646 RepID=A0A1V6VA70_9EURO|nr:hypothetical protein PENCOP_c001G01626 [Penicillium coprophilum]
MYEVVWTGDRAPNKRPVDALAATMGDMSFAVGKTPIDTVLAYMARCTQQDDLEEGIWALRNLLRAEEDGVDAQIATEDEIQANSYAHFDDGNHFFLPAQEGVATQLELDRRAIQLESSAQHLVDAIHRRVQHLRWEIFAWWWCQVSEGKKTTHIQSGYHDANIDAPSKAATRLQCQVIQSSQASVKTGVIEAFHQRNNPTLVIGGVKIMMASEELPPCGALSPIPRNLFPGDLLDAGNRLVREFVTLRDVTVTPDQQIPPPYHDKMTGRSSAWRNS